MISWVGGEAGAKRGRLSQSEIEKGFVGLANTRTSN